MNRRSMTLYALALGLCSVGACDKSPSEERAEARREMGEALDDHRKEVKEAEEEHSGERAKEITEANEKLAEKQKEAYEDVKEAERDEAEEARDDADDDNEGSVVAEGNAKPEKDVDAVKDRFEAYKGETKSQFETRAHARIAALEGEIKTIEGKTSDAKDGDTLSDARNSLAEAKKDLDEVVHGTDKVFDDGKAGVAVAINKARRKVERVRDDVND